MINNVAHNRFLLRLRFMLGKNTCTVCTVHIQVHIKEELNWFMADRSNWLKEGLCCVVTMLKNIARSQKADLSKSHPLLMCQNVVSYFLTNVTVLTTDVWLSIRWT